MRGSGRGTAVMVPPLAANAGSAASAQRRAALGHLIDLDESKTRVATRSLDTGRVVARRQRYEDCRVVAYKAPGERADRAGHVLDLRAAVPRGFRGDYRARIRADVRQ